MKRNIAIGMMALFAVAASMTGCGTLNSAGPYKGDKVLYDADLVITTSYDVVHQFVTFEEANRAALASNPAIKAAADSLRARMPGAFASALSVRDAYAVSATAANASALQTVLDVIRAMAVEATKQLVANKK